MHDGALGTAWMRPLMGAVRFAEARGIPLEDVVRGTSIRSSTLIKPEARVPIAWIEVLFARLGELAGETHIGLRCAEHVEPASLDVYHYFGSSCDDVGEALRAFASVIRLLSTSAECSVVERGNEVMLMLRMGNAEVVGRHTTEYSMACIASGLSRIAAQPVMPKRVSMTHSGTASDIHRRAFACPVELGGAVNALIYDQSVIRAKTRAPDPALKDLVRRQVQQLMDQLPATQSFASELRSLVIGTLPSGELSLEWIAKQVAMSPRTFQRSLAAETEMPFRDFVDAIRKELALALLSDAARPVAEVAYDLGYADARAFARAFHRWYGRAPSAERPSSPARPRR